MKKNLVTISVFCLLFLLVSGAYAGGITQKTVTITIPSDYQSKEPYKSEFVVPEGTTAFKFTIWGSDNPWGITDISDGRHQDIYSSTDPGVGGTTVGDAESGDHQTSPPSEGEGVDPLAGLSLNPGTYLIWISGRPGNSITLQYLVQTR